MTETIYQSEATECGLACIAMASETLGAPVSLIELRRRFPVSLRGSTLKHLVEIIDAIGLSGRAVRCEVEELSDLTLPAILHWNFNHFVVLQKVRRSKVLVLDPARGARWLTMAELSNNFTGVALEVTKNSALRRRKERSPLNLWSLVTFGGDLKGAVAQVLLISLVLQAYVLASPLYMQLAIDEAALKGDSAFLVVIALGFGAFAVFNVIAEVLRNFALQRVNSLLNWSMTRSLYRHFLRLPLPWFQRRNLADTLIRFDSIDPVRQLVAGGLVVGLVDGVLSLSTLILMFVFAWPLALVVLAAFVAQSTLKVLAVGPTLRLGADALVAQVAERAKRIETIKAIQTIKVMGGEVDREADWANRFAVTIRKDQANANLTSLFGSLASAIEALSLVLIVFLAAKAVIDGSMTVGVIYAFMSYRQQFVQRASGVFDIGISARMLDMHSDRLADIALAPIEAGIDSDPTVSSPLVGRFELQKVSFRYAPHEPPVFQAVNLVIEAGEAVAFVGPSGSGKTTLMKVMAGLYPCSAGEIMLDGVTLQAHGPKAIRQQLGVVLQDDELLSGTILENVSFFAPNPDVDWVWECLRLACLEGDVRNMPMQIHSFVGDMGSALSGGQKQRLLLARALYRKPRILILDEATSHLDVEREREINGNLKALSITRLIVAHRPNTIAMADRVILVQQRRAVEIGNSRSATSPSAETPLDAPLKATH